MVSSTPRPHFTPGKEPVPILQEAGWAPGPVWTGRKSRPNRDSIPDRPARSSAAIPTELTGPQIQIGMHVEYPLFFLGCSEIFIFSVGFTKNDQISNFMKIRLVGRELCPCGQTDRREEANSRSSQILRKLLKTVEAPIRLAVTGRPNLNHGDTVPPPPQKNLHLQAYCVKQR